MSEVHDVLPLDLLYLWPAETYLHVQQVFPKRLELQRNRKGHDAVFQQTEFEHQAKNICVTETGSACFHRRAAQGMVKVFDDTFCCSTGDRYEKH